MITQNFQDIFTYEALYRAHLKGRLCKRDKRPLVRFEMRTLQHLHGLYLKLQAGNFKFGTYSSFIVYEPKKREIVSQGMLDKVVNHLVSRHILYPAILPCLIDTNVASRSNLGTKAGLEAVNEFHRKCKVKYGKYYNGCGIFSSACGN